jgi:RNA-directed DNA polymerase
MSDKTHMNGSRESYSGVVPAKRPNESQGGPKEIVEGRPLTKENADQFHPCRTQRRESGPGGLERGLERVRQAAKGDKQLKFTALPHHVNVDLLRSSCYDLKRNAAAGVDGVTWQVWGDGLEERLTDLHGRIHRGAYHAQPSRRVWIPKTDGRQRARRGSRRWRIKSSRVPWCRFSTRSGKRTFRIFRTGSGRGAIGIKRWMHSMSG